ncbi:uncharacterized protein [Diadema setosum]|uniref:uncharacterized protein n=1 Tax=Diadema setosum TaxID=31175 RepID=UPI003B3A9131
MLCWRRVIRQVHRQKEHSQGYRDFKSRKDNMPDMMRPIFLLCLCAFVGSALGQRQPQVSRITSIVRSVCGLYQLHSYRYGHGRCNRKVIDEVHDHADKVFIPARGFGYIHGDFVERTLKLPRYQRICYTNGQAIYPVRGPCDMMELVCNGNVNVDFCRRVHIPAPPPPPRRPMTTAPPVPRAPVNPPVPGAPAVPDVPPAPGVPPVPGAPGGGF